jgi:hypothetical protein
VSGHEVHCACGLYSDRACVDFSGAHNVFNDGETSVTYLLPQATITTSTVGTYMAYTDLGNFDNGPCAAPPNTAVGCMIYTGEGVAPGAFPSYTLQRLSNLSSGVAVVATTSPLPNCPGGFLVTQAILCNASAPLPIAQGILKQVSRCEWQVTYNSVAGCPAAPTCDGVTCVSCGATPGCGWCLDSGKCFNNSPPGCSSFVKNPKYCPADACTKNTSCVSCTSNSCIWCLDSNTCGPGPASCENKVGKPSFCPSKKMLIL